MRAGTELAISGKTLFARGGAQGARTREKKSVKRD